MRGEFFRHGSKSQWRQRADDEQPNGRASLPVRRHQRQRYSAKLHDDANLCAPRGELLVLYHDHGVRVEPHAQCEWKRGIRGADSIAVGLGGRIRRRANHSRDALYCVLLRERRRRPGVECAAAGHHRLRRRWPVWHDRRTGAYRGYCFDSDEQQGSGGVWHGHYDWSVEFDKRRCSRIYWDGWTDSGLGIRSGSSSRQRDQ